MGMRLGLVAGFAAGLYVGARAGRERLDRVESLVRSLGGSPAGVQATSKARAIADLGLERLHDLIAAQRP